LNYKKLISLILNFYKIMDFGDILDDGGFGEFGDL
jgi:hypothetical protein